jgi:hypothetical protein
MQRLTDYGYARPETMADWGCSLCRRVIYKHQSLYSLPEQERTGVCSTCAKVRQEAERRAAHLWELAQLERLTGYYAKDLPQVTRDLLNYLVGLTVGTRIQHLYRKLGLTLPNRLIPLHEGEF